MPKFPMKKQERSLQPVATAINQTLQNAGDGIASFLKSLSKATTSKKTGRGGRYR